jgi:hypothetical protein
LAAPRPPDPRRAVDHRPPATRRVEVQPVNFLARMDSWR